MVKEKALRAVSVLLILLMASMMSACKNEDITKLAENEEKLLRAITEYNTDLIQKIELIDDGGFWEAYQE